MKRPRVLWTDPHTAKPLLAVVNIPLSQICHYS